ncbi:MAG: ABC transporter ATP-binding protein [bacterium]
MHFGRIIYYYWQQVRKYKWSFYLTFATYGAGVIIASIINPFLYKQIIDLIAGATPSASLSVKLFQYVFLVSLAVITYISLFRAGDFLSSYFQSNVMREIHNETFGRLMNHSYKFFSNNFSGSLVSKAKRFASSFERISDITIYHFWFTVVHLSGVLVILFLQAQLLGFLFLGWTMIYIIITGLFIRRKVEYDLLESAADSKVTGRFADAFTNILNIKIFSSREKEHDSFKNVTFDEYKKRIKAWNFGNFQNMIQGFLMAILQIVILYTMVKLWLQGSITTGMVVLVQIYMFAALDHLWDLGKSLVNLFKAIAEAKEMVDIFEEKPDIEDIANPEKCMISKGDVDFKDVNFEYVKGYPVFTEFNFNIKSGEKVGLVGHSGSGKSTIVKILLRFADVQGGAILIDGQNITKIKQEDLRQNISYVPQEPILFHRSIRENIGYAKKDATEDEIIEAAKKAHAHEFVSKLPHGYDTLVGERGVKLSGGERQRIAIARAMLKDSPVLMLDEATSSLDSISESYIQEAFAELMKGKTTVVIAHRLSTVQQMDRIVVLDKGQIVEEGTHKELLEKNGQYADLWNHQTGGFLEE